MIVTFHRGALGNNVQEGSLRVKKEKRLEHSYNSLLLRKPGTDITIILSTQVHVLAEFHHFFTCTVVYV